MNRAIPSAAFTALAVVLQLACMPALAVSAEPQAFYVSPTGTPGGDGTPSSPWDLQTALNQTALVVPGSTIWVSEGCYPGAFVNRLNGTAAAPIVVRAKPNMRVFLDGSRVGVQTPPGVVEGVEPVVNLAGSHTWLWGFDIGNSDPKRTIAEAGSNPVTRRATAVSVNGPNNKVINCLLHDCGEGLGSSVSAPDAEFYGNVVFHNGWAGPDRQHGHGVYCQNKTGTQTFRDNIVLHNFALNFHLYGSSRSSLNGFRLEGNVALDGHSVLGGGAPMRDLELVGNYFYNERPQFGYQSMDNDGLVLRDNVFPVGFSLYWWKNVTAAANAIFNKTRYTHAVHILQAGPLDLSTYRFDENTYYWSKPGPTSPLGPGAFFQNTTLADNDPAKYFDLPLPEWQRRGQDRRAKVESMPMADAENMRLIGKKVVLRKNQYDPRRATLVIYNWDRDEVVPVDVAGVLAPGDRYELHNVQNWHGDVVEGTFRGGALDVPMAGHSVGKPVGWEKALGSVSFPEFGAFTLLVLPRSTDEAPRQ